MCTLVDIVVFAAIAAVVGLAVAIFLDALIRSVGRPASGNGIRNGRAGKGRARIAEGRAHASLRRVDALDLQQIGPVYEMADLFPDRVNAEFVEWIDRNKLKVRVWERGSGETLACGTGACAAAVAAVLNGLCDRDTDIVVQLLGGQLTVRYSDGTVYLTGDCINVFEGTVSI